MRRASAIFLSWILVLNAQQVGTNTTTNTATGTPTFSTSSQLVVETVSVKDKSGNPVEGLTKENFTVTEDGIPQTIRFFEFQKLDDTPLPEAKPAAQVATAAPAAKAPEPPKVGSVTSNQIVGDSPGNTRYRNRRLLAAYFDIANMPIPDQLRAVAGAQKFITKSMTGPDLMCLMVYTGTGVKVLQDFTDDRDLLLSQIDKFIVAQDQGFDQVLSDANSSDTGAAFGQDDSEFNLLYTDRQLAALQTAIKMLGTINGQKALIYFVSGLNLNGTDNQAQLHATENAAVRADVKIFASDTRGLVASGPMGDATRASSGGQAMYTGGAAMAMTTGLQKSQDAMYALATDTGGKALLDTNDLSLGIVNAEKSVSSYYMIAYYTTNSALNGKFHRVKITLNNGTTASLDYRQGYYAGKEYSKFTTADKETQLGDALAQGDPITELSVFMEVDYFRLNNAEYFIPIMVKIPGSELVLAKKGGAQATVIDFIGEVKDEYGNTMTNVRDKVDKKLSDSTAAELAKSPILYATGFTLLPGKYKIKVLARDAETGRMGTFEGPFTVPNLNYPATDKRVPISSVVLSSQRMDLKDVLFTAAKDKGKSEDINPLVLDGQKLIPSVTRVFSKTKDMYVYFQAYELKATSTQPLVAFITFYKGQSKAFETPPMAVTEGLDPKFKDVPMRFSLALSKLPPGEYDCQVTVLDPNGDKATFWRAPVILIP